MARLSEAVLDTLAQSCEAVRLRPWQPLCTAGRVTEYAYFPTTSIIGLSAPTAAHATVQVALVGWEGAFASPLMAGTPLSPLGAVALTEGWAFRMHHKRFRSELSNNPVLQLQVNRFLNVLIAQIAELVTCTRYHPVEARLARWLLMVHDRSASNILELKQETLAQMLGVQRTGVTLAAVSLRQKNLIRYARGRIELLDRAGLEHASCACYGWANYLYASVVDEPLPAGKLALS